jgi:MFS family permease
MAILFVSSLLLVAADQLWVYFIFAVLFGLAWGGTSTLRSTVVAELFGLSAHGMLTGAIFFIAVIGGTIAPILTGYIFDVSGQYHLAFVIIAALAFVGMGMAAFLNFYAAARRRAK